MVSTRPANPDDRGARAPVRSDKWTLKEVVGHVADSEPVFCYALSGLPVERHTAAGFDRMPGTPSELAVGLVAMRRLDRSGRTLTFVRSLDDAMALRAAPPAATR
jgi:hypothetical protein